MKLPKLQNKLQEFSDVKCTLKLSYATRDFYTELLLKWERSAWSEVIKVSDREMMLAIGTTDWTVVTKAKNQLRKCGLLYFITNKGVSTQYFLTASAYLTAVESAELTTVQTAVQSTVRNTADEPEKITTVQTAEQRAVQSAVISTVVFSEKANTFQEKTAENQEDVKNFNDNETDSNSEAKKSASYTTTSQHILNTTDVDSNKERECKGKGKEKEVKTVVDNWRNNFEIYVQEANAAMHQLLNDEEFILSRETYYPFCDVKLSIQKMFKDFWATKDGWINKTSKRSSKSINWKSTVIKNLGIKNNRISKTTNNNGNKQTTTAPHKSAIKSSGSYDEGF